MKKYDLLRDCLDKLNMEYSEDQIGKFGMYYELLIEWNNKMNLTAITELSDVIIKHFVDSLLIMNILDLNAKSIIDVGTGAGFPGIPLKIMNPGCSMVLIDSLNKRVGFLKEVTDKLDLKGIECIHSRAEDLARDKDYREKFDISVSRAVANLSTLSEYCLPFIKTEGLFISYKSDKADDEIDSSGNAIKLLNSVIVDVKNIEIPETDILRKLIIIRKNKSISNKYPRKAGLPSKEPL